MFQHQPLIEDRPGKDIAKVGYFSVINRKGHEIKTSFPNGNIYLKVGKQNDDKDLTGFGINHIYYKHFNEIDTTYHVLNQDGSINYQQTIIDFLKEFLTQPYVKIYQEEDSKPLLIKSSWGLVVLKYRDKERKYSVVTFSKKIKPKGCLKGELATHNENLTTV